MRPAVTASLIASLVFAAPHFAAGEKNQFSASRIKPEFWRGRGRRLRAHGPELGGTQADMRRGRGGKLALEKKRFQPGNVPMRSELNPAGEVADPETHRAPAAQRRRLLTEPDRR